MAAIVQIGLSLKCKYSLLSFLTEIDEISDPIQAEQYKVIADYKKQQKNEVDLVTGDVVEVFEKNENGELEKWRDWTIPLDSPCPCPRQFSCRQLHPHQSPSGQCPYKKRCGN